MGIGLGLGLSVVTADKTPFFNPVSLQPIVWLDGSDPLGTGTPPADNTPVGTWFDKSGLLNNAVQATGVNQPLFIANTTNNVGSLLFDGVNDTTIVAYNSSLDCADNFTYFVVGDKTSSTSSYWIGRGLSTATAPSLNITTGFGLRLSGQSLLITLGTFAVNTWNMFSIAKNGATIINRRNRVNVAASGSITFANNAIGITIPTSTFAGYVAEVIIYNRALNISEIQAVESYLFRKWRANG